MFDPNGIMLEGSQGGEVGKKVYLDSKLRDFKILILNLSIISYTFTSKLFEISH